MNLDLATGAISDGSISLVPGQSMIIGSLQNYTAHEVHFTVLSISFDADLDDGLLGTLHDGILDLETRSLIPTKDIGRYLAAQGVAVIPLTGSTSTVGTRLDLEFDPREFLHYGNATAATINLGLGTASFEVPELAMVPEPSAALLVGIALGAMGFHRTYSRG